MVVSGVTARLVGYLRVSDQLFVTAPVGLTGTVFIDTSVFISFYFPVFICWLETHTPGILTLCECERGRERESDRLFIHYSLVFLVWF